MATLNTNDPTELPAFARRLLEDEDKNRLKVLTRVHPHCAEMAPSWCILLDDFESAGGFLTGDYLWQFTNEQQQDYERRKSQARHHGYLEALIDVYTRHIFSTPPKRTTSHEGLAAFWRDVDGAGTDADEFMRELVALSLVTGHCGALLDMTPDPPTGPSMADQRARPLLAIYTAPSIIDWRVRREQLVAVKLLQAALQDDITAEVVTGTTASQFLLWDTDGWARFDATGELIGGGTPALGLVPFAVLRPKPSMLNPFFGRPLIANAKILQALFNRMSEHDQVIRDQAASLLTVEVGPDGDVEAARKQLGTEYGTQRAVVVQGKSDYKSSDMRVPEQVRASVKEIIREIYRAAHVRIEKDSLEAESAEAIRLQFAELNEMLQGVAADAADVERQLARFYFAWTEPTPEAAQVAFDAAHVSIEYASEFFEDSLSDDVRSFAESVALQLGTTMTRRIKSAPFDGSIPKCRSRSWPRWTRKSTRYRTNRFRRRSIACEKMRNRGWRHPYRQPKRRNPRESSVNYVREPDGFLMERAPRQPAFGIDRPLPRRSTHNSSTIQSRLNPQGSEARREVTQNTGVDRGGSSYAIRQIPRDTDCGPRGASREQNR